MRELSKREQLTALITGASSGLGREFAWICAENGYDLVITARNLGKLNELKCELEAKFGVKVFVVVADLAKGLTNAVPQSETLLR